MFGLRDIDLKHTRVYQDAVKEGHLEGHKKGRIEGRLEGRMEGRMEGQVEGEATLLMRLLERRFGPLSAETRQRIASTDAETLLIYGDRVLDAKTLADVFGD